MNKQDRMMQKIEAEPEQWKRIWLMIQYVCEFGTTEQKDSVEKLIEKAAGYPEKAEA
jgi:hypothetical protein